MQFHFVKEWMTTLCQVFFSSSFAPFSLHGNFAMDFLVLEWKKKKNTHKHQTNMNFFSRFLFNVHVHAHVDRLWEPANDWFHRTETTKIIFIQRFLLYKYCVEFSVFFTSILHFRLNDSVKRQESCSLFFSLGLFSIHGFDRRSSIFCCGPNNNPLTDAQHFSEHMYRTYATE